MNPLATAASVATLVAAIGGGAWVIDERYAQQQELNKVSERLDLKILEDRANGIQTRIWALQDRYGEKCGKERDQCRQLQYELEKLQRILASKKRA